MLHQYRASYSRAIKIDLWIRRLDSTTVVVARQGVDATPVLCRSLNYTPPRRLFRQLRNKPYVICARVGGHFVQLTGWLDRQRNTPTKEQKFIAPNPTPLNYPVELRCKSSADAVNTITTQLEQHDRHELSRTVRWWTEIKLSKITYDRRLGKTRKSRSVPSAKQMRFWQALEPSEVICQKRSGIKKLNKTGRLRLGKDRQRIGHGTPVLRNKSRQLNEWMNEWMNKTWN